MNIRTFVAILSRNPQYDFPKMRGGSKAVWNFSENSSVLETPSVPNFTFNRLCSVQGRGPCYLKEKWTKKYTWHRKMQLADKFPQDNFPSVREAIL